MAFTVGGRDWQVVAARADATVADLAAAVGVDPAALPVPSATPLTEWDLAPGATVDRPEAGGSRAPTLEAVAVGGLDGGRRCPLPGGRSVLGRAVGFPDDPAVSRRHAGVLVAADGTVAVTDRGSRNGTWLVATDGGEVPLVPGVPAAVAADQPLRLGATEVLIGPSASDDVPVPAGGHTAGFDERLPFNRPPRPATARPPDAVAVPEPLPPPSSAVPLGLVAVVGPLVLAGLLVVVLDNPLFAVLALLSPVLAVGNHVEARRRRTRTSRRLRARRGAELAAFADALAVAAAVELARRRDVVPDPAEVARRALLPSTRLWERRPGHDDHLRLRVGVGDVAWDPPLAGDRAPRCADVAAAVAAASVLHRCPATVDLAGGGVVGVVGPRPAALAVARSLLCQVAVHHGPADVPVAVACSPAAAGDWDWAKWLPHVEDPAGAVRLLATGRSGCDALATAVLAAGPEAQAPVLVVDGPELLVGRRAPMRVLLGGRAAGIVVAAGVDRLPSSCTAVVLVDADGEAELRLPALGRRMPGLRAAGMAEDTAERCARALARFDDPDLDIAGVGLPTSVRLLDLLGLADPTPDRLLDRWSAAGRDGRLAAPIGVDRDGPVEVDLVADGPHALVGGTTGAGKSELLRTLVAGVAASAGPDHVTFLLVDFKGGSAFDACGRLPHVVGVVTDLDDELAARALRCLDAELRHRERLLRQVGADDLDAYRRAAAPDAEPLPRLVVVVDEFATLKAELPGFVDALLGVAQRGRSLGVHLVLATQRPAGAVSDAIRANTNLRVALRVQDPAESADVVDVSDAAHLPRDRPGRACVRLGPGEVLFVQTALASAPARRDDEPAVRAAPFRFEPGAAPLGGPEGGGDGPTDLELLASAAVAAWASIGRPPPRRPWPDPLPPVLRRDQLPDGAVALGDDPDHQRHVALGWDLAQGNLVVHGVGGSGTTTTLLAVGLALAWSRGPDRLHLYAVDHGAGELGVLGSLPHTGAVIVAAERERQRRLVRALREMLDHRRALPPSARRGEPAVVVLVDGIAALLAAFDDVAGLEVLDALERVFADGPEVGIHVALTADRPGALPTAMASLVRQRWVHRLADPLDAGAVGLAARPPALVPGRFVDAATGHVAQVGVPAEGWAAAVARCRERWAGTPGSAPGVGELPRSVPWTALGAVPVVGAHAWHLPLGVADDDLEPASLALWEGEHALVAGPARSGRTTALATVGGAALAAGARVLALAGRRSWLRDVDGFELVGADELLARVHGGPTLLLVDDADGVDDPTGALGTLVAGAPADVRVVAAGRSEVLRGLYDHWSRAVRRSRAGLLLQPHLDLDGDLLGAPLPRRVSVPLLPGRGFLVVDGVARLVHVAQPPGVLAGSASCPSP